MRRSAKVMGSGSSPARIPRPGDRRSSSRPDLGLVDCGADRTAADSAEESEAREVERRYRTLVEQLPLVVYVDALDEGSSNIFTSDHIEPLLGYSVEEWRDDPDLFVRHRGK